MTADHGYGKATMLDKISSIRISSEVLCPTKFSVLTPLWRSHFCFLIGKTILMWKMRVRLQERHSNENFQNGEETTMDGNDNVHNHRSCFVINYDAQMGQAVFIASKTQSITLSGQLRVTAVAVREHGTAKFFKALRFMHSVPCSISTELDTLVVVLKLGVQSDGTLSTDERSPLGKFCKAFL